MKRFLEKMKQFISDFGIAISLGMVLTVKAVELAYEERGYLAFGGEYLVLPVILMYTYIVKNTFYMIVDVFWDDEEECRRKPKK